jgi:hypothetical protein
MHFTQWQKGMITCDEIAFGLPGDAEVAAKPRKALPVARRRGAYAPKAKG